MTWTPDQEVLLKILWAQGLSALQIGKRLGYSRNAVISKIHRMGLPKRIVAVGGTDKDRSARVKAIAKIAAMPASLPIDRSRETGAARGPWNIPFMDRNESTCRMFVGGESRETGLICGRGREEGKPYCSACARIAYLPPKMKRRVA